MYKILTSFENLYLAYRKASKGKRGKPNVAVFEYHLEDHLYQLQSELESQIYQPGAYASFYIHEPKRRLISAAKFRDRVVHHALINLIEPVFECSFIYDSYANRVEKGTHRALDRTQQFLRKYKYVLQCDLRQFFASIDHEILLNILSRKIKGDRVMTLCEKILASGVGVLAEEYDMVYFPGDDLFAINRPRGLPIGNLTSQFWANVYMNPFDHFVKRELGCKGYLRYVDDFLLFANNKQILWDWLERIQHRLAKSRLVLHPGCHPKPVTEGVRFLGFRNYPNQKRLIARNYHHFNRKYKKMVIRYQRGEIDLEQLNQAVLGWVNHVSYANSIGIRKKTLVL